MINQISEVSVTKSLLIINIGVYVGTSVLSGSFIQTSEQVLTFLGQANKLVIQGYIWQLLTSIFVHVNIVHIFGNMIFLMIFGIGAEVLFNKKQYLIIYISSGLFGSLLSLFLGFNAVSAGASGAIFGLFGAVTIHSEYSRAQSILMALVYSSYFFILNIGINVNLFSHAGGLIIGLILGYKYAKGLTDEEYI